MSDTFQTGAWNLSLMVGLKPLLEAEVYSNSTSHSAEGCMLISVLQCCSSEYLHHVWNPVRLKDQGVCKVQQMRHPQARKLQNQRYFSTMRAPSVNDRLSFFWFVYVLHTWGQRLAWHLQKEVKNKSGETSWKSCCLDVPSHHKFSISDGLGSSCSWST